MQNALTKIEGWNLHEVNGEPAIKDIDLGKKLGYERPRDIRKLIRRIEENGNFNGALPWSTHEIISGNETKVFYLTEKQALKVISRSETETAFKIMDEVIDVFLEYHRHGYVAKPEFMRQLNETNAELVKLMKDKNTLEDALLTLSLDEANNKSIVSLLQVAALKKKGLENKMIAKALEMNPLSVRTKVTKLNKIGLLNSTKTFSEKTPTLFD